MTYSFHFIFSLLQIFLSHPKVQKRENSHQLKITSNYNIQIYQMHIIAQNNCILFYTYFSSIFTILLTSFEFLTSYYHCILLTVVLCFILSLLAMFFYRIPDENHYSFIVSQWLGSVKGDCYQKRLIINFSWKCHRNELCTIPHFCYKQNYAN